MFVATAIIWIGHRMTTESNCQLSWIDPTFVLVEVVFFLTSRDTLRQYQQRTKQLLTAVVE